MAQIEYCDDETKTPSWHPSFERSYCGEQDANTADEWLYRDKVWLVDSDIILLEVDTGLRREFMRLAAQWRKETRFTPTLKKMVMNSAYQRIMAMGRPMIRYILEDLQEQPDHWFWAL